MGKRHWLWDVAGLLIIPALVVLNGLFVAAEFSLVSVRKTRIEELIKRGVKRARSVESAMNRLDRSIAATQLGITLASIGLGFVGEPALADLIEPLADFFPADWRGGGHGFSRHRVGVSAHHLYARRLRRVDPQDAGAGDGRSNGFLAVRPSQRVRAFLAAADLDDERHGQFHFAPPRYQAASGEEMVHSVEELLLLIEDTEEAGILDPDQADFVQNVFRLSNKRVRDCMVPREKMAALELSTPPDKVLEAVRSGAHTRMPVYEGADRQHRRHRQHEGFVLPIQSQRRGDLAGRDVSAVVSQGGREHGQRSATVPPGATTDGPGARRAG